MTTNMKLTLTQTFKFNFLPFALNKKSLNYRLREQLILYHIKLEKNQELVQALANASLTKLINTFTPQDFMHVIKSSALKSCK